MRAASVARLKRPENTGQNGASVGGEWGIRTVQGTGTCGDANGCPARLQVGGKYGTFQDFQDIPEAEAPFPMFVARYIDALAMLQAHTSTLIVVPDLTTGRDAQTVLRAAKLLGGRTAVGTWKAMEFVADGAVTIDPDGHYQLGMIEPLTAVIGAETLTPGPVQNTLMSAKLADLGGGRLRAEPHLNDTAQQVYAPDEPVPPSDQPVRSRPAPDV